MVSDRQAAFRADYRQVISPLYSPLMHVVLIYALGLSAMWLFIHKLHQPSWLELAAILPVLVVSNLFEWFLHQHILHRPRPGFMGIYKRHSGAHHQFYTNHLYTIDCLRDFRITLFPPYLLAVFMCITAPPALIVGLLWSANAGWLVMATTTGYYLVYEMIHLGCHCRRIAFCATCR